MPFSHSFKEARSNMVSSQLRTNKVTDPSLIEAMESVPREQFVPEGLEHIAYSDEDINLGEGRFLLEPMVLARMLQAANLNGSELVLEIGSATGYSTAVLSKLSKAVVAVDENAMLTQLANENLSNIGADNAVAIVGDMKLGIPEDGPYDLVFISGSVSQVPETLFDLVAPRGQLLTVERTNELQYGIVVKYSREKSRAFHREELFQANTPILQAFKSEKRFEF